MSVWIYETTFTFCFHSTNCRLSANLLPVHLFLLSAIFFSFCLNNLQVCYVFCPLKQVMSVLKLNIKLL